LKNHFRWRTAKLVGAGLVKSEGPLRRLSSGNSEPADISALYRVMETLE
jgi:hypothetical protein